MPYHKPIIMTDYKPGMGQRIKRQRKLLKLTQENLAEKLGISVKHFSEVERGLTGLSIENIIKLSSILGLSLDYMIKGSETTRWDNAVSYLQQIPNNKEQLAEEIIHLLSELSKI